MNSPESRPKKPPRWLLRRPDPDAPARLFLFPYSGCGASMYQAWPRRIGAVDVCLIQPPARQNRIAEPHYGTYENMARDLVEYLRPHLDRPFAFFGHCGGALPGVEVTRQLAAAGLPLPERVFVSAQVAPHDGPYGRLLELDRNGLRAELGHIIANLGGEPSGPLIEMGLQVLVNDLEANKRYSPGRVALPSGITAIGWSEDVEIPTKLMGGWQDTSADSRLVELKGDHFAFLSAPEALLAEIRRDFGEAAKGPAGQEQAAG
ncbi:thioesterase domain-containing protein [Streptomyces sp. NBC_01275]|uniref:thioesterase II family protein n=1 Tax=Streptomyces sp. NBC_01275 TaxID=2903807 RepID=UPI0022548141|nr:thioesterase domain-containing protein [Streptomyces sp. NBC_01275]MCX4762811.1 thioesterase domain-containing protein [Streptomyces sp. NBC_01275]